MTENTDNATMIDEQDKIGPKELKKAQRKKYWSKVFDPWSTIPLLFLDPWVIIMVITCVVLALFSYTDVDPWLYAFLTFLLALSSGIAGGVVGKKWDDYKQANTLAIRGLSAVRALKLILNSMKIMKDSIKSKVSNEEELDGEVVLDQINIIETQIFSSIEDWTDLLPDQKFVKPIWEKIAELEDELLIKTEELNTEITSNDENQEMISKLRDDIIRLRSQIGNLNNRMPSTDSGGTILPFASGSFTGGSANYLDYRKNEVRCPSCDQTFLSSVTGESLNTCPYCGTQFITIS